jgi:hypothetical protein
MGQDRIEISARLFDNRRQPDDFWAGADNN